MTTHTIGIIGASGYTGSELVRILSNHPSVKIQMVTSESHKGKRISTLHPHLAGACDIELVSADTLKHSRPELVFLALPHGVSMRFVKDLMGSGTRIVDLSGDFRLSSREVYERWYEMEHVCPEHIDAAVFGLPELYRDKVRNAELIANPGCYPTSVILALAPLLAGDLIETEGLIADSKSGVSGAGAKAKAGTHYPTVNDSFKAYGLFSHRHSPEIREVLAKAAGGFVDLLFTPHLVPMTRGILTTTYSRAKKGVSLESLKEAYAGAYENEPFVRVRSNPPATQHVKGSNYCDVFVTMDEQSRRVITVSAIDNLVKGAAGQAVQNMNIMLGIEETAGLMQAPLAP